jgi:spore germination cell wall hydrolase CwlJ-like protein
MTDLEAATLCAMREAANQPDEGVAAIVEVLKNRTALHYASDGTLQGTIDRHAQFSWTENDFVNGRYQEVAFNPAEELARIQTLLAQSEEQAATWARCQAITEAVLAGTFSGPLFDKITPTTVLYYNPQIVAPYWAATASESVVIGQHRFMAPNDLYAPPTLPAVAAAVPANDADPIQETLQALGQSDAR